jgi:hypothetical protein
MLEARKCRSVAEAEKFDRSFFILHVDASDNRSLSAL